MIDKKSEKDVIDVEIIDEKSHDEIKKGIADNLADAIDGITDVAEPLISQETVKKLDGVTTAIRDGAKAGREIGSHLGAAFSSFQKLGESLKKSGILREGTRTVRKR